MAARKREILESQQQTVAVHIAHSSPGRLRLRVDRAGADGPEIAEAANSLEQQSGVIDVRFNRAARSLVIHYDERALTISALVESLEDSGLELVESAGGDSAERSSDGPPMRRWLADVALTADQRILKASRGTADLRTLLPVSLAALAAREILSGRTASVPWYALAWYAFDSFHKLRKESDQADRTE